MSLLREKWRHFYLLVILFINIKKNACSYFLTSICLSSSFSKVGYLSSLMKGLLRPVVRVRMPGELAPLLSMKSPSSSLQGRQILRVKAIFFLASCGMIVYNGRTDCSDIPVISENVNS